MNALHYRHLVLTLLLFFGLPSFSALRGQIFPEDVRLSHPIPQTTLPEDAKIQSSATLDDITLVVWGSSRQVGTDSVANTLYWQLFRDTVKLGEPQRLLDDRFNPFGYLQVTVLLDAVFLITWNDRRDGEVKTWRTFMDRYGNLWEPAHFWEGPPLTKNGLLGITRNREMFVLWNDTAQGLIMARKVGPRSIHFLEDAFILDEGYAVGTIPNVPGSGRTVIDRVNRLPIVFEQNGTISRLQGKEIEKFAGGYYIHDDGSVVALRNDTIREYRALFDTLPRRTIAGLIPRDRPDWRTVPGSGMAAKDKAGRITLSYSAYSSAGGNVLRLIRYLLVENGSGSFNEPAVINNSQFFSGQSWEQVSRENVQLDRYRLCNGVYQDQYRVSFHYVSNENPPQRIETDIFRVLALVINRQETRNHEITDNPTPADITTIEKWCPPVGNPIRRMPTLLESRVGAVVNSVEFFLSAPVSSPLVSVPYIFPLLQRSGEGFRLSSVAVGRDTTLLTETWSGRPNDPVVAHSSIPFDPPDESVGPAQLSIVPFDLKGASLLQTFYAENVQGGGGSPLIRSHHSLHMLVDTGWREIARAEPVHASKFYRTLSAVRDPDDGTILAAFGWASSLEGAAPADSITVAAYGANGDLLWKVDGLKYASVGFHLLPQNDRHFGLIKLNRRIYQYDQSQLIRISPPLAAITGLYAPCSDENFTWLFKSGDQFSFEQLDNSGNLLKSGTMLTWGEQVDHKLLFNPYDSSVVLLYSEKGSPETMGVYAVAFDKELKPIVTQKVSATPSITARPSGTFRSDTLFAAWEDYRGERGEIYVNAVVMKDPTAGVTEKRRKEGEKGLLIASVSPNPARETIRVGLGESVRRAAKLELWNAAGNRVLEREVRSGAREALLDVRSLPVGVYYIRLTAGERQEARKVVVE